MSPARSRRSRRRRSLRAAGCSSRQMTLPDSGMRTKTTSGGGTGAGEIELNAIPTQYLSTSRVRDQATIDFLAALVPNPFRGLLPGSAFNAATIARSQLLRPFPQFGNIRTFDDNGTSRY